MRLRWWAKATEPEIVLINLNKDDFAAYAKVEQQVASDFAAQVQNQAAEMAKWLIASLLILNGGGALAVLHAAGHIGCPRIAASLFICGIALALLNGWLLQVDGGNMGTAFRELARYYAHASASEKRDEAKESMLWQNVKTSGSMGRKPAHAGWASAILFLVGATILLASYQSQSRAAATVLKATVVTMRDVLPESNLYIRGKITR